MVNAYGGSQLFLVVSPPLPVTPGVVWYEKKVIDTVISIQGGVFCPEHLRLFLGLIV